MIHNVRLVTFVSPVTRQTSNWFEALTLVPYKICIWYSLYSLFYKLSQLRCTSYICMWHVQEHINFLTRHNLTSKRAARCSRVNAKCAKSFSAASTTKYNEEIYPSPGVLH